MVLKVHIALSVICFVLIWLDSFNIKQKMIKKYGIENAVIKKSVIEKVYTLVKSIVSCFIPIFNILLIAVVLFCEERAEKMAEQKILDRMNEQGKDL